MKKLIYVFVAVFSVAILFSSCKEQKKEVKEEQVEVKEVVKEEIAMAEYQCPMQCEGDKTYSEMGTCPECKMDLKEVDEAESQEVEEEDHSGHDD